MKITNAQLKQIIKEELQQVLNETEELNEVVPLAGLGAHALKTLFKRLLAWMIPNILKDPRGAAELVKTGIWYHYGSKAWAAITGPDTGISEEEFSKIIEKHAKIILEVVNTQAGLMEKELNKLDPGVSAALDDLLQQSRVRREKGSGAVKVKSKK